MDYTTLFSEIQEGQAPPPRRTPSLYEVCHLLADGRRARGKRYDLAGLLVVLVLAKLAGMQSLLGASQWVQDQEAFLRERLHLSWKRMRLSQYLQLCAGASGQPTRECHLGGLVRAPGGRKSLWRGTKPFSDTSKRATYPSGN